MAKQLEKDKAIKLRKKGESISEISRILGVSKGSVSVWVRDVIISASALNLLKSKIKINGHAGRIKGACANQQKKTDALESAFRHAVSALGNLTERDLLLLGIGLFWAEGNKKGSRFVFSNSDPGMILFMIKFLKHCMGVVHDDLYASVQINQIHQSRSEKIILYWCKTLGLKKDRILGPYFIKSKSVKIYDNSDTYYGILRLQVRRSSILHYRILGYIRSLSGQSKS